MVFDATIRVSDLFVGLAMLIGGYGAFLSVRNEVKNQRADIAQVKLEMKKQTDILIAIARQDERINNLESQMYVRRAGT